MTISTINLADVMGALQSLSSETSLDALLATFLRAVMDVGATKGVFLMPRASGLFVEAVASLDQSVWLQPTPLAASQEVPIALVHTVAQTLQSVALTNVPSSTLETDPYLQRQQPKSILCLPLLRRAELLGVVYLESATAGIFTHDRAEIFNLLSVQMSLALENVKLYQASQAAAAEREKTIQLERSLWELQPAEAELQLKQFSVDRAATPIWWVGPDARISYVNDAACRDLGYTRAEIIGRAVFDFNPDIPAEAWAAHWQELRQRGSFTLETRNRNKAGVIYPVEVTVNYIQINGKEYNCAFAVNISDRKAAEAALRVSETNLRTIFNNVESAIFIHDLNGTVLDVNDRMLSMYEVQRSQALIFSIVNDYSASANPFSMLREVWARVLAGETVSFEWKAKRPNDGSLFDVCVRLNKITLDENDVVLATVQDISDRKQAEAIARQKTRELESALQDLQNAQLRVVQSEKMSALGNLVAGVAHEINNPVGFLSGNIQPALDYINDVFGLLDRYQQAYPTPHASIQAEIEAIDLEFIREDLPKLVSSMQSGVDRIRSISTSLRTFSRTDTDTQQFFNLHDGLDSTILILKHRLKAHDSHPEIKVCREYGNLAPVICFPGQINQVFMNILANAIDALEEGMGKGEWGVRHNLPAPPTIWIQTSQENKYAVIRIRDNGVGMSQDVKQKIFEHLFTTKSVGRGTGLGLAIARQIVVERHGGSLEVQSELGQGTEFVIRMPMLESSGRMNGI